jgi:hypothetical protein
MFASCTSLVEAPLLPAETLVKECYYHLFYECSRINYIKALFTTQPSTSLDKSYTTYWVYGVASSGTFIKSNLAYWDETGVNGVPDNWIIDYSD